MTSCDFEILIGPYHDQELEEDRAAEMAKHIVDCRSCAEHLAEVRRISGVINRIPLDPISGIERSRMYQLVDQLPRRATESAIIRMAGSLAALAASVLLITSIWLMGTGGSRNIARPVGSIITISQTGTDQANSNLSHWMVRNLGGDLP